MKRHTPEPRVFDRNQAVKTLHSLEATVEEYRRTHHSDDGIRARLARINALKSMLNKPQLEGEIS